MLKQTCSAFFALPPLGIHVKDTRHVGKEGNLTFLSFFLLALHSSSSLYETDRISILAKAPSQ